MIDHTKIDTSKIDHTDMIKEIESELELRQSIYKERIQLGKMKRSDASFKYKSLLAVLRYLKSENQKRTGIQKPIF